jgi:ribonuclease HI
VQEQERSSWTETSERRFRHTWGLAGTSTVFQAEVTAMEMAVTRMEAKGRQVELFSDSQAAIKALQRCYAPRCYA